MQYVVRIDVWITPIRWITRFSREVKLSIQENTIAVIRVFVRFLKMRKLIFNSEEMKVIGFCNI